MVEFKIVLRGHGIVGAVADGYFFTGHDFVELLERTPEPLLPPADFARLRTFLLEVPPRKDRRTKQQRNEGAKLSELVRASTADALCEEANELLLRRLAGTSLRRAGRPKKLLGLTGDRDTVALLGYALKRSIEARLQANLPLEISKWGSVTARPEFDEMPLSERSTHLAHAALCERGFEVPSIARLRNRMSKLHPSLRELIVKDWEEDRG